MKREGTSNIYLKSSLFISLMLLSLIFVSAAHNANSIYVRAGGADKTLQAAINDGSICSGNTGSYSGTIAYGHYADDIKIFAGNSQRTLQQAVNTQGSLYSNTVTPIFSAFSFGHASDSISITIGGVSKNLQTAINAGDFNTLCTTPQA
ncbi:MAG: hypothetical protein WC906_05400, partial [Parcubacteria group bacterium]